MGELELVFETGNQHKGAVVEGGSVYNCLVSTMRVCGNGGCCCQPGAVARAMLEFPWEGAGTPVDMGKWEDATAGHWLKVHNR